jgi:glycosyltransferase involved in cell wall biosynthesis
MKIVQLAPSVYPVDIGGIENHVYNLSHELVKKGCELEILTNKGRYDICISGDLVLKEKMSMHRFLKYLLTQKFDIIHIHGLGTSFKIIRTISALLISRLRMKRVVFTPHGSIDMIVSSSRRDIKSRLFVKFLKCFFKSAKFICVNPWQKFLLYGIIPKENVLFIPNGIPDSAFSNTSNNYSSFIEKYGLHNKRIICYVGRLIPSKRVSDMIYVMDKIRNQYGMKNVHFIIAGPAESGYVFALRNMVNKHECKDCVTFLGKISENEKYQLLGCTEIFVSPSSWEAFGISLCEAMAKGIPVVSADNIGARYLLGRGKYGLLYDIGNVNQLLEKILYLLDNPREAKRIGNEGRKRATLFKWSRVVNEVERVYAELVQK